MAKRRESAKDFRLRMVERLRAAAFRSEGFWGHLLDPEEMAVMVYDLLVSSLRASVPGHQRSSIPWRIQLEAAVGGASRRIRNQKWPKALPDPCLQPKTVPR
jgi:hypothetical protein